jgi:Holliday junction DNA helicase RuvA
MIASLKGVLEGRGPGWALIRVGGVGFQVYLPASSLARLGPVGKEVEVHTHLYLREEVLALYGFATAGELGLFQSLIGVRGVGPKLALALLSALTPDQLTMAIASGNEDLLTQVPGIGRKTAQRLILELKGKLEKVISPVAVSESDAEIVSALTNLGYTLAESTRALSSLPQDKDLALEDKIKLALQNLGAR